MHATVQNEIATKGGANFSARLNTVHFDSITKRFGNLIANDSITCSFTTGGVHALLGENGAGKSTLMKILCGSCQPDQGKILIDGHQVVLASSSQARRLGIGMVHQQLTLVPSMNVLENVLLGDPRVPILINKKEQTKRLRSLAAKAGMHLELDKPVDKLSMAERQKVEILKLLWRDARILILDEPTSQLPAFEAEDILLTAQELAREDKVVILISHHIDEILRFASRITVLRGGKHVTTIAANEVQAHELASLMVDRLTVPAPERKPIVQSVPYVRMRQVTVSPSGRNRRIDSFDADLFAGEIFGIAGVIGSGQEEIARILTGHLQPQSGSLFINGQVASWSALRDARTSAGYVPADPKLSTISNMSARDNSMLRDIHHKQYTIGPFLKGKLIRHKAIDRIGRFDIRPSHPDSLCSSFSGGNRQRLVLSRELDNPSPLFVAVNPTAGLDIAMTQRVLQELRSIAAAGRAVVLVSPDLQELLDTCDRILVMSAGHVVGTERVEDLDAESLGLLIGGVSFESARTLAKFLRSKTDESIDNEMKQILVALLQSERNWQRRIACQIAFRTFGPHDMPIIENMLACEENAECSAWLRCLLAKHGSEPERSNLEDQLKRNTAAYLEIAKKIWQCDSAVELHARLKAKTSVFASKFEEQLAFVLRDHIQVAGFESVAAERTADGTASERLSGFDPEGNVLALASFVVPQSR